MGIDVIAVGDVLVDVVVADPPQEGGKRHTHVDLRAGGSAVNAVLAAAAHGASVALVGRVGSDPAAAIVRDALEVSGVTSWLAVDPTARTGTAVAVGDSVVADPGASARLSPADVPAELDAGAVLVSGYTVLQEATAPAGRAALERARARWKAISVGSTSLAERHGLQGVLELAAGANVLFADEEEARALTGLPAEAAASELSRHFEIACVTRGEHGALAASAGDVVSQPAVPGRGGLGAGDALAGVLLVELTRGRDLRAALAAAVNAASTS